MEPRDRPGEATSGGECAACGQTVPASRIRLLATREDLAFAELSCGWCGSQSLAIVVSGSAAATGNETQPTAPPIGPDDVLDMHQLLAGHRGGLRELVEAQPIERAPRRAGAA